MLGLDIAVWERSEWRPEDDEQLTQLPEEFSFVHVLGVPDYEYAHWAVARAGWVSPLRADGLQQRINEKAKRISSYQNAAHTNWLVIVADATKPSSLIAAKEDFTANGLTSPFERTFFYRYPDSLIEL